MPEFDYAAACERAAADQGLTPVAEALDGIEVPWGIEQTGGFCMALTSYLDGENGDVIVMSGEGVEERNGYGQYYLCRMPAAVWMGVDLTRDSGDFDPVTFDGPPALAAHVFKALREAVA